MKMPVFLALTILLVGVGCSSGSPWKLVQSSSRSRTVVRSVSPADIARARQGLGLPYSKFVAPQTGRNSETRTQTFGGRVKVETTYSSTSSWITRGTNGGYSVSSTEHFGSARYEGHVPPPRVHNLRDAPGGVQPSYIEGATVPGEKIFRALGAPLDR